MIQRWPLVMVVKCLLIYAVIALLWSAQAQDRVSSLTESKDLIQSVSSIQGTRWALLIGIADYPSSEVYEIPKLKASVKDVNALAEFLKHPRKGGFDPDHVFVLTDAEAKQRNILIKLEELAKLASPGDMVIFYFAGHGVYSSGDDTVYLIPYDHDLSHMKATCINFSDLEKMVYGMKANKVVMILDACHSAGVKPKDARSAAGGRLLNERYLRAFRGSEGRALLLSSGVTEVSWETEEYGIFTHFLLEGLEGEADKDKDAFITFTEVSRYVEDMVPEYTQRNFPSIQQPKRRYLETAQVRGDMPMAINWDRWHKNRQIERNVAIYEAARAGMDNTLKEFSLQVTESAYRKAVNDEELTDQESLLLQEIDNLKDGKITPDWYIDQARSIYEMGMSKLSVALDLPADGLETRVTLAPADAPDQNIQALSPNTYQAKKGRYILSVEAPGCVPYSREVVLDKRSEKVSVALKRLMGTLKLQVEPEDAAVNITPISVEAPDDEIMVGRTISVDPKAEKKLPAGKYSVMAQKDGYEISDAEVVEIAADTPASVAIKLTPKPAIIVAPDLPDDARVLVNGERVTLPHKLPPGKYRIRMEREGYQPFEESKELKAGLEMSLHPRWIRIESSLVHLRVSVTPTDSEVALASENAPDRTIQPSSPNAYQVMPGRYRLSVKRKGYEPYSRELTLDQAGETVPVTLERLVGTLRLRIEPDDAKVTLTPISVQAPDSDVIEGKPLSVRPTDEKQLPIGTYRVDARKDGYQSVTEGTVEIKANTTTPVTLLLKPVVQEPATIVATYLSDDTRAFVDGNLVKLPHKLPPGTYTIRLERDGFQTFETSEELRPAQVLSLKPEWRQMPIRKSSVGEATRSRAKSFGYSLLVPGLGQHLQGRHVRGAAYETAIAATGVGMLLAINDYGEKLDRYESKGKKEYYDSAQSARRRSIAMQAAFWLLWAANVVDAGIIEPRPQSRGVAFEARPTSDGLQFLVRAKF